MRRVCQSLLLRLQQSLPGPCRLSLSTFARAFACILCTLLVLAVVPLALDIVRADAPADAPAGAPTAVNKATIAHGKYLVHHVAQCVQCHTPRDEQGALLDAQLLSGAPIPVDGPANMRPWASVSVSLVGLGNYDESFVRYLLVHGRRPDGTSPKAPMPAFRLNDQDVDAVIAYLKSLP